ASSDCALVAAAFPTLHLDGTETSCCSSNGGGISCTTNGRVSAINLDNRDLAGTISDSLGQLTELTRLSLDHTGLSGTIPQSLAKLTQLQFLSLAANRLTGSVPDIFASLPKLGQLDFSFNNLTGTIPDSIGGLSQLEFLNLENNQLMGRIPPSFGGLTMLWDLNLANNQLSDVIPDSLGQLSKYLQLLNLKNNQLSGSIPDSLGQIARLKILDISNNSLTGIIPDSLGNLKFNDLYVWFFAGTFASAYLPSLFVLFYRREISNATNNMLTGPPPNIPGLVFYPQRNAQTPSQTPPSSQSGNNDNSRSTKIIAGTVSAGVFLAIVGVLAFWRLRKAKSRANGDSVNASSVPQISAVDVSRTDLKPVDAA
ncbi:hypothetical protein HDU76_006414, partial [Blyttiomyces sp. JEL0837]